MPLVLADPPASLAALMLESVIDHLNAGIETGESPSLEVPDLAYIEALTEAAVGMLDGPSGKLRRCLLTQSWTAVFDRAFPPVIELVLPPIQSIQSISYTDPNGANQTLASESYTVSGLTSWLVEIAPALGESWPAVRDEPGTINVQFFAGYGDSLASVPRPIVQAIRMMVAHWYANRAAVERTAFVELPLGVRDLLAPFRVWR